MPCSSWRSSALNLSFSRPTMNAPFVPARPSAVASMPTVRCTCPSGGRSTTSPSEPAENCAGTSRSPKPIVSATSPASDTAVSSASSASPARSSAVRMASARSVWELTATRYSVSWWMDQWLDIWMASAGTDRR